MIYNEFAQVYDKLMYDFPYKENSEFLFNILGDRKIKVLEMAAGTGNFTKILGEKYHLHAFDISENMLSIAQNKVKNVFFFKADMVNFKALDKYDAILCLCDSYNYLLKEEDLFSSFKCVYQALEDNGIFIFDMNTKEKFLKMDRAYVDDIDDIFYSWENYFDENKSINHYCVNFFVEEKEDLYRRFYEEHLERAYPSPKVKSLLEQVGFKSIEIYKDYKNSKQIEKADRLVYVVKKRG